ncbi:hypothetical protein INT45_000153 [Circinella minor]|uniref:C2H2-type domain-containing protein n=1 Tax=Circinella minor TaxID=1195481 RepID=A0A8H7VPL6_9FUNG|nr:hypothetical protein INT45_000153 [Circinella minor]
MDNGQPYSQRSQHSETEGQSSQHHQADLGLSPLDLLLIQLQQEKNFTFLLSPEPPTNIIVGGNITLDASAPLTDGHNEETSSSNADGQAENLSTAVLANEYPLFDVGLEGFLYDDDENEDPGYDVGNQGSPFDVGHEDALFHDEDEGEGVLFDDGNEDEDTEERFRCPFCPENHTGFARQRDIQRHIQSVHARTRHICDICGNHYGRSDTLKRRRNTHN